MIKKSNIIFLGVFLLTYTLFQYGFRVFADRQERIDSQQTKIIQENIQERFNAFLKLPISIGMMGAEIFSSGDLSKKSFGSGFDDVLKTNQEILGLNIVDHEGRIIRVNPMGSNPTTIGKVSQNFAALKESYAKGEKYWFSPPFQLYQGPMGFAIYVPIVENKKLKGWFAPVISTELFNKKFELIEYAHIYDLMIKDTKTGLSYFTSFDSPYEDAQLHIHPTKLLGRDVSFQSWRKEGEAVYRFPWYVSFALALFLTLMLKLVSYLFAQKRQAHNQLNDINALLRLTSAEALSKLVDMHKKFNATELTANQKENFSEAVTYLKHLIEQIDLLQTMSLSDEELHHELRGFLPLLVDQIKNFTEVIREKHLDISFKSQDLEQVMISSDGWPLQNSVLSSILSHSIVYAKDGSKISIENKSTDDTYYITFHTHQINRAGPDGEATHLDRRLEVARRILNIYKGQLILQNDLAGGMLIRIMLPIHA